VKGEFDFIRYIKKSFGLRAIGDDCAILPKTADTDLAVTADLIIEGIDFHLEWTKPEHLGHKVLAVSLSDISAMGASPKWSLLSLGVPQNLWDTNFVKRFYEGWIDLATKFGVELVGGDISRSPDKFFADSVVCGEIAHGKAVLRSGARPGDQIFVSGKLGGAAGGLRLLENSKTSRADSADEQNLIERLVKPFPRVNLGQLLSESCLATSMIDISDGLSSDIHHICEQSVVGAMLEAALIPIDESLQAVFTSDEALSMALNGGEDFELLFTVPSERVATMNLDGVTRIGSITADAGRVKLVDAGQTVELRPSGYRHF
jgi:thiamine-monophosphate kinase